MCNVINRVWFVAAISPIFKDANMKVQVNEQQERYVDSSQR